MTGFDFGKNWLEFSDKALTPEKISQARRDFSALMQGIPLKNKTFLDIGFGQGLSLLAASEKGARTYGNDINARCLDVLHRNARFFPAVDAANIEVVMGSILDPSIFCRAERTIL